MVVNRSTNVSRVVFILSFISMLISVLLRCIWNLLANIAGGRGGLPSFIHIMNYLLVASVVALLMYFKWPWVALIVGWVNAFLIARGVFPWEQHGLISALQQFKLDVVFIVAAHVGVISYLVIRRTKVYDVPN